MVAASGGAEFCCLLADFHGISRVFESFQAVAISADRLTPSARITDFASLSIVGELSSVTGAWRPAEQISPDLSHSLHAVSTGPACRTLTALTACGKCSQSALPVTFTHVVFWFIHLQLTEWTIAHTRL